LSTEDKISLVALAGYGRQQMFPCSDVDLMFLSRTPLCQHSQTQVIPKICQALWDLHLRVSPTVRTLDECGKLHRDNTEFNISLLDCCNICGDAELFYALKSEAIPRTVRREALELQQRLLDYQQTGVLDALTSHLQSEAAVAGIGLKERAEADPAEWIRQYYRRAR